MFYGRSNREAWLHDEFDATMLPVLETWHRETLIEAKRHGCDGAIAEGTRRTNRALVELREIADRIPDWNQEWQRGVTSATEVFRELEALRPLVETLRVVKIDGWTQKELCTQGCISPSTFDRIREAAGVTGARDGEHGHQYGTDELERLREKAASKLGKRTWARAAERWALLLESAD